MDPKLRPSFQDIVRNLEEILARLKVEEMEHECVPLSGDIDKKTIPKGNNTSASAHLSFNFPVTKSHLPLFTRSCLSGPVIHSSRKGSCNQSKATYFIFFYYILSPLFTTAYRLCLYCTPIHSNKCLAWQKLPSSPNDSSCLKAHCLILVCPVSYDTVYSLLNI